MATRLNHPEHMTVAATAPNELDAGVIMNALEDAGIDSMMAGYDALDFRAGIPSEVEVLVAEEDLERAQQALKMSSPSDEQDEHGVRYDSPKGWRSTDVGMKPK